MQAGQKLNTSDGQYQVMLFPIDEMYITQGEGGTFSHMLAMDFVGWNPSQGQIPRYPYYAPCDMVLVAQNFTQAWQVWESVNPVYYADGSVDYISLCIMHDNNFPHQTIGDRVSQGDLLGRTGTAGYVTGDHAHFNLARGKYAGWTTGYQFNELANSMHLYNGFNINDTTKYVDYGYNWKIYEGGVPPTPPPPSTKKKHKFKWVLYSRNIRARNNFNNRY